MLKQLGFKANSFSCMQIYKDICKSFILDKSDKGLEKKFSALNQYSIFTDTFMTSLADKKKLAKFIINHPIDWAINYELNLERTFVQKIIAVIDLKDNIIQAKSDFEENVKFKFKFKNYPKYSWHR